MAGETRQVMARIVPKEPNGKDAREFAEATRAGGCYTAPLHVAAQVRPPEADLSCSTLLAQNAFDSHLRQAITRGKINP